MKSNTRIVLAFTLSFVVGMLISYLNGQGVTFSIFTGILFAILATAAVVVLSWGMDMAVEKGYPDWTGFFLVLVLNVIGFIVLAMLPNRLMVGSRISK